MSEKTFKHSEETRRKIAESVKRAHKTNPRTKTTRQKLSSAMLKLHKRGQGAGFGKGNRLGALRKPESVKKAFQACMAVVIGSHGFGCMEKGRTNHLFAKSWVIKCPNNKTYRCSNLLEWCRLNEAMFGQDGKKFTAPLWDRVASGLSGKGKWYGWRVISVSPIEREEPLL
jgi:hypothetical protein